MKFRNRWVWIVMVLLVAHVSLMSWAVVKATTDRNAAVIPDYYARSTHWDEQKAMKAASDRLGWQVTLTQTGERDALGDHGVAVRVVDPEGNPVKAGSAELTYHHDAYPDEARTLVMKADAEGRLGGMVRIGRRGFYTLAIVVRSGDEVYVNQWTEFFEK